MKQQTPALKFIAASVPRFIRYRRLRHVSSAAVVHSFSLKADNEDVTVYDTLLLPEEEYRRICLHLSVQTPAQAEPSLGDFNPAYIPQDAREILVHPEAQDPFLAAKELFLKSLA